MAAAETKQLQNDHQPRDVARKRIAEAGAVRKDEICLKLGQALVRDARVGEEAEAGIDAVDGLAACDDALDRARGFGDAGHRGFVEPGLGSRPELPQVV